VTAECPYFAKTEVCDKKIHNSAKIRGFWWLKIVGVCYNVQHLATSARLWTALLSKLNNSYRNLHIQWYDTRTSIQYGHAWVPRTENFDKHWHTDNSRVILHTGRWHYNGTHHGSSSANSIYSVAFPNPELDTVRSAHPRSWVTATQFFVQWVEVEIKATWPCSGSVHLAPHFATPP
jgi:hypothetical protein